MFIAFLSATVTFGKIGKQTKKDKNCDDSLYQELNLCKIFEGITDPTFWYFSQCPESIAADEMCKFTRNFDGTFTSTLQPATFDNLYAVCFTFFLFMFGYNRLRW